MRAVRRTFLMIKTGSGSYWGTTTGRSMPVLTKTMWEPRWRANTNPSCSSVGLLARSAMTRITPVQHRKIVRVLELEGFVLARQRGSHMVFVKTGIERPVVVPQYDPLPVFIIKNVLRTARISRERYFELLEGI